MANEPLELSPDSMTIGDMEDFEEATGMSLDQFYADVSRREREDKETGGEGNVPVPAKCLKALVWIEKRRSDPSFTLADARNVKVTELRLEPERPTRAARRAAVKKKPSKQPASKSGARSR